MASRLCQRLAVRLPLEIRRRIVTAGKDPNTAQYFDQLKGQLSVDSSGAAAVGKSKPVLVPIETTSVATGLFVNQIDYGMLVYPEFSEIDDLNQTEEFAKKVGTLLKDQLDPVEIDKTSVIPDELLHRLKKLGLFGMRIPTEYGGLEMNDKQVCRVYEELSQDWSVLLTVYCHHELVTQAILKYGTEEQKRKYLPRLASGESIGAFCLHEEGSGYDVASLSASVKSMQSASESGYLTLNGTKSWVTNGQEADILIVFAKYAAPQLDEESGQYLPTTAFIVDRKSHVGIKTLERRQPIGLHGASIHDLQFENVGIHDTDVLGDYGRGFNVAMQGLESHRYVFAAAVAAFLRRLLAVIAKHCNETKRFGATLSETVAVQSRVSTITRNTYILETMAYYIAGIRDDDESGEKHFQLESSMATLYARRALREAIADCMEIFGATSTTTQMEFERLLRDCVSLCAFLGSEDILVTNIALKGLTAWAFKWRNVMHQVKRPLYYPWFMFRERLFAKDRKVTRLKHYLYEHVHPSLEDACRNVEQTMSKFEYVFQSALKAYGKEVENEHGFLDRVANMSTFLFGGIACISRASRSYSIGLRKADLELLLAHEIGVRLSSQAEIIMDQLFPQNLNTYQNMDTFNKNISTEVTGVCCRTIENGECFQRRLGHLRSSYETIPALFGRKTGIGISIRNQEPGR